MEPESAQEGLQSICIKLRPIICLPNQKHRIILLEVSKTKRKLYIRYIKSMVARWGFSICFPLFFACTVNKNA